VQEIYASQDNTRLAVTTGEERYLWDLRTGALLLVSTLRRDCAPVALSADGARLIESNNIDVCVWDVESASCTTLKNHGCGCLAISPSGAQFACAGPGSPLTLYSWDAHGDIQWKLLCEECDSDDSEGVHQGRNRHGPMLTRHSSPGL